MKMLGKVFSLLAAVVCLTSPFGLSASNESKVITVNDIIGTYQVSGFSNSFINPCITGLNALAVPSNPESEALVGQFTFNAAGVGTVNFLDLTVVNQTGGVIPNHFENVSFTYIVGPLNGYGTLTLLDFPNTGENSVFAVSFKRRCGKVIGFSAVITQNPESFLWLLLQGERF